MTRDGWPIPVQFREALSGLQDERLVAHQVPHRHSTAASTSIRSRHGARSRGKLLGKNRFDPQLRQVPELLRLRARTSASLDAQGRILLPPLLRDYAGIKRDVMFTGDIDKFRIWDKQVWQQAFGEDERGVLGRRRTFLANLDL